MNYPVIDELRIIRGRDENLGNDTLIYDRNIEGIIRLNNSLRIVTSSFLIVIFTGDSIDYSDFRVNRLYPITIKTCNSHKFLIKNELKFKISVNGYNLYSSLRFVVHFKQL